MEGQWEDLDSHRRVSCPKQKVPRPTFTRPRSQNPQLQNQGTLFETLVLCKTDGGLLRGRRRPLREKTEGPWTGGGPQGGRWWRFSETEKGEERETWQKGPNFLDGTFRSTGGGRDKREREVGVEWHQKIAGVLFPPGPRPRFSDVPVFHCPGPSSLRDEHGTRVRYTLPRSETKGINRRVLDEGEEVVGSGVTWFSVAFTEEEYYLKRNNVFTNK